MSLTRFYIQLFLVIAYAGCTTNEERVSEPSDDATSIAADTYVEPNDEDLARMIPGPHDAELYTNVIEIHMDESGVIMDKGKEITIADLVSRIREQPRVQDVQLNIIAPSGTPVRIANRIQRKVSESVPELERISVVFQSSNTGG